MSFYFFLVKTPDFNISGKKKRKCQKISQSPCGLKLFTSEAQRIFKLKDHIKGCLHCVL
jgi:hypothetical protein